MPLSLPDWKADRSTRFEVRSRNFRGEVFDISAGLISVSVSKAIGSVGSFALTYHPVTYEVGGKKKYLTEILLPNDYVEIWVRHPAPTRSSVPVMVGLVDTIVRTRRVDTSGKAVTTLTVSGRSWEKVLLYPLYLPPALAGLAGDPEKTPVASFLQQLSDRPIMGKVEVLVREIIDILFGKPVLVDSNGEPVIPFSYKLGDGWVCQIPKPEVRVPKSPTLAPVGAGFIGTPQIMGLDSNTTILQMLEAVVSNKAFNDIYFDVVRKGDEALPVIYLRRRPVDSYELLDNEGVLVSGDEIMSETISISDDELFNVFNLIPRAVFTTVKQDYLMAYLTPNTLDDVVNVNGIRKHGIRLLEQETTLVPEELFEATQTEEDYAKSVEAFRAGWDSLVSWLERWKWQYGMMYFHGNMTLPFTPELSIGKTLGITRTVPHRGFSLEESSGEVYNIEAMTINWSLGRNITASLDLTRGLFASQWELKVRKEGRQV